MRIVELSTYREDCGIATYTEALTDALVGAGAGVTVLAPKLRRRARPIGEQPQRLWRRDAATLGEAMKTWSAIETIGPDVVHAQVNLGLFSARFLTTLSWKLRRAKIPFFVTLHERPGGTWFRDFRLRRLHRALSQAYLVVHNPLHASFFWREKLAIIPHGIFEPQPAPLDDAKRSLGIEPHRPVLAHFGFLHPDKGIGEVLEALDQFRRQGREDLLYWVGGGTFPTRESQAYLDFLRHRVRELELDAQVRITGEFASHEQVLAELRAADWIVLNYRVGQGQGTSGAARHALIAGRPLALSNAPIFDDLRDAAHTLRGDLSVELERLLADRDLTEQTQARARRFLRSRGWPEIARQHLRLFESQLRR